jgi:hypothetical protein
VGNVADVGSGAGRVHVGQIRFVLWDWSFRGGVQSGVRSSVTACGGASLGWEEARSALYSLSPNAIMARSIASSAGVLVPSKGVSDSFPEDWGVLVELVGKG